MDERTSRRLEWRRSNACAPRRNRHREHRSGQKPPEAWELDEGVTLMPAEQFDELAVSLDVPDQFWETEGEEDG